jgi:acetyl-CoA C-acetyltransferase
MEKSVVVAGWGQLKQPKEQATGLEDALGLMAKAARQAAETSGVPNILKHLDAILVVRVMSTYYEDAAAMLAEKIGARPRLKRVSSIGGNSPQTLVNIAAGMIARGELERVLIAGAETYYPRDEPPNAAGGDLFRGLGDRLPEDDRIGAVEVERRHGIDLPLHGFPLFETALWAEGGRPLAAHMDRIGRLWSRFSQTAADHPCAWLRHPRTPEEIATPSRINRWIAFPYLKFMNSLLSVDMGAAVILMPADAAEAHRPRSRRPVYFLGGAYTEDRQRFIAQKSSFTRCAALGVAAARALERSRLALDEIECFDLYSCFPCAVFIARRMLGLTEDDPRPLTLTGGLAFFGGPGNNYSLHAVATLADLIARERKRNGLITSLGWFMHKHAAGVYGDRPLENRLHRHDLEDRRHRQVGDAPLPVADVANGRAVIETYTVVHDRNSEPISAVVYGKSSQDGRRVVAHTPAPVFRLLVSTNMVGRTFKFRHDPVRAINTAEPV